MGEKIKIKKKKKKSDFSKWAWVSMSVLIYIYVCAWRQRKNSWQRIRGGVCKKENNKTVVDCRSFKNICLFI